MAEEKTYTEKELEPLFYSAHALLHFLFDPDGQTRPECVHWLTLFKEAMDSFPKPNSLNIVIEDMVHRIGIAREDKVAKVVSKGPSTMMVVFESGKFYYLTVSTAPPNI
jgi:hypothetical protein